MTSVRSCLAASILGLALFTVATASQASPLSGSLSKVAQTSVIAAATVETFNTMAALGTSRVDASIATAGGNVSDATIGPVTPLPEPETIGLLGLGIAAMALSRRRRPVAR